ncbi:hypothetical protein F4810DRAFT_693901 [Camillea tinctor]|nr:hypothetical protein F4810DRAFT_693901 [Camillea tinctor]
MSSATRKCSTVTVMSNATFPISLMGAEVKPLPKKDDKGKEVERDGREIIKFIKKASTKTPQQREGDRRAVEQLIQECEIRRRASIHDGEEFLRDFLNCHFEEHLDQIRITCDLTLEQIKMIGNEEDQMWGVSQCQRLFNAPVLSDQIGYLLWCELRQGDTLDHSHEKPPTDKEAEERPLNPIKEALELRESEIEIQRNGSVNTTVSEPGSPTIRRMQRRWSGMPHDNHGWNLNYFPSETKTQIPADSPSPSSPASEPDEGQKQERAESTPGKPRMPRNPRKKVDYLMEGIRKRTVVGAGYLAASLASGYSL